MRLLSLFSLVIVLFFSSCSTNSQKNPPFNYDLRLTEVAGSRRSAVICLHGFGGDYKVAKSVEPFFKEKATVISFNFPDYGKKSGELNPELTSFGSIEELLPALYVLKHSIIDRGFRNVCVYGFSAGGAALVNLLYVLSTSSYDLELKRIGISKSHKKKMLEVISKGDVILDTPLKSIDEIVALHGLSDELRVIGERYKVNGLDPINSLQKWKNLSLNVLVHFQEPDKIVSNRDDDLFVELLKKYNQGKTRVLKGSDAGHSLPHTSLWTYYLDNSNCF